MTHADINDLETRDYIFKIGDRGKGIQAHYDENTDALIFPRAAFDYVFKLLKESLSQEPKSGKWIRKESMGCPIEICSKCSEMGDSAYNFCPWCGARMVEPQESEE